MKTNNLLIIAFLSSLVIFTSCNNDDNGVEITPTPEAKEEPKEETPVNNPPGTFDLISVEEDEVVVDFNSLFTWEAATDPDGDTVTYDFYLARKEVSLEPVAIDLTTTILDQELSFSNEYQWKVVAKDPQGASSESETFPFSTRNLNQPRKILEQAGFSGRQGHGLVSFQDRLLLFGGTSVSASIPNREHDLWYSANGIDWTKSVDQVPFGHRNFSTPIVYKERLYIIGGLSSKPGVIGNSEVNDYKNDIWASNNGVDWTQVQFNALFSKRTGHSLVVFKDKIWLYGGVNKDGIYQNDIYSSEDGVTWNTVTANLFDVSARAYAKFVVFNDRLYLIGGRNKDVMLNEIWESENGNDWKLVVQDNEVPVNILFDAFVYRDKLILVDQFIENKIWYSDDVITWKSVEENLQFNKRQASTSVLYKDKIHIVGGLETMSNGGFGAFLNDVWVVD